MANDLKPCVASKPGQPRKPQPVCLPLMSQPRTKAGRDALKARRDEALKATFGMLRGKEILPEDLA